MPGSDRRRCGSARRPGGRPRASRADLSLSLEQVETNVALGDEAFTLAVPDGAKGLTLAELRQAGVLR